MAAVSTEIRTFDPSALLRLLDGRYAEVRQELRGVLRRPEFAPVVAMPTVEYRERVPDWAKSLAADGLTAPGFPDQTVRSSWSTGASRGRGATREVNQLCNETRLCAGDLVDAFGIPDEMLSAPIGLADPGPGPG